MKKILVATDLSERADMALSRATIMARELGGEITALFVVSDELPAKTLEQFTRSAETALKEQIVRVCGTSKASVQTSIVPGSDWSMILEMVQLGGHDIIVLGTHRMGREGFDHGATVERVIAHANVPVLVVPRFAEHPYRRPVVGVDFSIHSKLALKLARLLAPAVKTTVVHAWEQPFRAFLKGDANRKQFEAEEAKNLTLLIEGEFAELVAAQPNGHRKLHPVLRQGEAIRVLEAEISAQKADLLVLGTHGGGGFREAIVGSVAKSFLKIPAV